MIKHLLLSLISLAVLPVSAQSDLGALNIQPRRCGTSMILERETAAAKANGHRQVISSSDNYVPHTGTVNIPVILVNFEDVKFSVNNPQQAFEQFFNGDTQADLGNGNTLNRGSVAKYFSDMSKGTFNLKFKVYSPVTVSQNETYYGGSNSENNSDEKPRQLVKDAIDALVATNQVSNDDVTSFCNGGSTIDCVYIIYAGRGQNYDGDATTVWACTGNTDYNTTLGGKEVRWFSMAEELLPAYLNEGRLTNTSGTPVITGIGVTCHELSHALGLPDFYTTSSSAYLDNQSMEWWDLMDGGEYTYYGFCPTPYTAFEMNEMGWQVDIQELTEDKSLSMSTSTEDSRTAYKISNPSNSNEYLMLECVKNSGWWQGLRQYNRKGMNGLLVYHVNRPDGGTITMSERYNNTPGYPGMAVVPADGACLTSYIRANYNDNKYYYSLMGDIFPGTGNMTTDTLDVTELSDAKPQPNFCWYNSARTQKLATNKALRNITYDSSTGVVSLNYVNDVSAGINSIKADKSNDCRIYTIDGRYVGDNLNALPRGIYIIGGRKVVR